MKPFTIDNSLANQLEQEIITERRPRYTYLKNTADYNYRNNSTTAGGIKIITTLGFTCGVYVMSRDYPTYGTYEEMMLKRNSKLATTLPSVNKLVLHLKQEYLDPSYDIVRVFVNLMTRGVEYGVTPPHFDVRNPNAQTFLYYVIDSDGDTFIFDEEQDKVLLSAPPRKGTGITYPSKTIHSASIPTKHEIRSAINIVYCKDYFKQNGKILIEQYDNRNNKYTN